MASSPPPPRRQVAGIAAITAALDAGEPVRVLLVERSDATPEVLALIERARTAGAALWLGGQGDLRRMGRGPDSERAVALVGPAPRCDLAELFGRGGAVFLLHRPRYASNAGFAIRTAEVSGAAGIVVDAEFNHEERTRAGHVSMGADRVLPVLWASTADAIAHAERAGHRVIAIEDAGTATPWEVDLTGDVVLIAGGEREGIGAAWLARCHDVVRVPMAGFVPSYNLQAALSMVAGERLRQLATRTSRPRG
jgi:tRNA G18 (ribose-2'-O)-methylase SpoU